MREWRPLRDYCNLELTSFDHHGGDGNYIVADAFVAITFL